jgi:hypothetical protein
LPSDGALAWIRVDSNRCSATADELWGLTVVERTNRYQFHVIMVDSDDEIYVKHYSLPTDQIPNL